MDRSELLTLVFTDLAGSTALKRERGDQAAGEIIGRHRALIESLTAGTGARIVDWSGDGCFLTFDAPSAAVSFALALQDAHARDAELLPVRAGIHLGEVTVVGTRVEGLAVDLAARIGALALPGQVLLSGAAFDSARQRLRSDASGRPIAWRAHGEYLLKGSDEPAEICEAGIEGHSPLSAPPDSEKARRSVPAAHEETLGWRPAVGLTVPGRQHWVLEQPLGEGGFGEVWLASHDKTHARRVFKFCFEPDRIRGLRREVVLFRLLRETLGARADIAQIVDWEFDTAPYFIESEYTEGGDLRAWAEGKGGAGAVPLETRLELIAQAADALGAAHSVGVLHKDIKPGNILVTENSPGRMQACLTDFGIGLIVDPSALVGKNITSAGLTETLASASTPSSGGGTRMYMAPELIEGKPPSTLSDIYALGVVLYQIVLGDFTRALGPGWERDVADDLVREDIAACVDGDPQRRLPSAVELAKRLRSLAERRAQRERELRLVIAAEKAHRRWQQFVAFSVVGVLVTAAVAVAGLREAGLRRKESSARHEAELAKALSEQSEAKAIASRAESDRLREAAEYHLYVSHMRLADLARAQGNPAQTRQILEQSAERFRNWEWGNLALDAWPNVTSVERATDAPIGSFASAWRGANAVLYRYITPHSASVSSVDFSPDDTLLATLGYDGYVVVTAWQDEGVHWRMLSNQVGGGSVRFSHDGKWVAHTENLVVIVRDARTGEAVSQLQGHEEAIGVLCFTPDDETIITQSLDRTTRAWDWKTGKQRWAKDYNAYVEHIAPHAALLVPMPDSERFLISDERDRLKIGDVDTGEIVLDLPITLPEGYYPIAANPAVDMVLIYHPELMQVLAVDLGTGRPREGTSLAIRLSQAVRSAEFAPDGSIAFLRGILGGIAVFDLEKGGVSDSPDDVVIARGLTSYQMMDALAMTSDGGYFAAPQAEGSVFVFRRSREDRPSAQLMRQPGPAYTARFDPVHNQLVTVDLDGGMLAWDLDRRTVRHQWQGHQSGITELEAAPDYSRWLTGSYDGYYAIWGNESPEPLARIESGIPSVLAGGVKGPLVRIAAALLKPNHWSPDGSRIVLAKGIGNAQVLDGETLQPIFLLTGHTSWVYRCYYSPKGTMILTHGYQEPFVKIWDAATGAERFTLRANAQVIDTAFSPDESKLVATTLSPEIPVWNLGDGRLQSPINVSAASSIAVFYSPNGKHFATACTDGTAIVWNADGSRLSTLTGHSTNVITASFNSAGDRILTAAYDKTLRIWDLSGNPLGVFTFEEDIHYATWSPDGNRIAITTVQGAIHVLDSVPWAELATIADVESPIVERLDAWRARNAP